MHAPQIIWIILTMFGLGIAAQRDAKEFVTTSIGAVIAAGLLYWGGFFAQQVCR